MRNLSRVIVQSQKFFYQNIPQCYENSVFNRKISIMHIDQGIELILKAFILRLGYVIRTIKLSKVKNGLKANSPVETYLDDKNTISFPDALSLCTKIINMERHRVDRIKLQGISKLHDKRNKIQHYGIKVYEKTPKLICDALKDLMTIYNHSTFEVAGGFIQEIRDFLSRYGTS